MRPLLPPPLIGLLLAAAMAATDRWLVPGWASTLPGQQSAAIGVMGVGLIIEAIAAAAFFRAKTTVNPLAPQNSTTLVVTGLYRFSRNPMYLGMAILLTGWALWLGNPANAVFLILFVALITVLQIKPEEKALRDNFGDEYDAYCARVRRWI